MFFFFKKKKAYEISACLVGSEMRIRDRVREDAGLRPLPPVGVRLPRPAGARGRRPRAPARGRLAGVLRLPAGVPGG